MPATEKRRRQPHKKVLHLSTYDFPCPHELIERRDRSSHA